MVEVPPKHETPLDAQGGRMRVEFDPREPLINASRIVFESFPSSTSDCKSVEMHLDLAPCWKYIDRSSLPSSKFAVIKEFVSLNVL